MTVADTDVLIDFLRGTEPNYSKVRRLIEEGRLSTSVVCAYELQAGAGNGTEEKRIDVFLGGLEILDVTSTAAHRAAEIGRDLRRKGKGIGMADTLIAGTCLLHGFSILTGNRKHFERVPGLMLA